VPRYAAIDVGSNSIRSLVADVDRRGRPRVLASDRQVVRLGTGVFRDGRVSDAAMDLACRVLRRMADEFRDLRVTAVRAVATSAIRDAANQVDFVACASAVLGTPLEVISGLEEARLVERGVHARWPHPKERVLIVDVGGGSAQLLLAEKGHLVEAFSKPLGAVRLTETFLKHDPPTASELARLQRYVQQQLVEPAKRFGRARIRRVVATSSTAAAIVCAVNEVSRSKRDDADHMAATIRQVRALLGQISELDLEGRSQIVGIGPRRAEIVVAGVAVLHEILVRLKAPRFYYSAAGVRDGIIAELASQQEFEGMGPLYRMRFQSAKRRAD
jgi:exopolyphosphatase/guanosine-5'-triphosphate,3'-diphosphate pyrophosphatase